MANNKTANLLNRVIKNTIKVPEHLTVSEWAEKHRILDDSAAISGKWNNSVTPYLVGIMDELNNPDTEHITFIKPTQVGGTEAMNNMVGWVVMQDPSPTMIVYPIDDLAKDTSTDRLKPAIMKSPELRKRFYENRSKELNLKFSGMNLYIRSGGSPSKLASKPIKYLFFDEIDKMNGASKKEASPYQLALERTKTYKYSKKIFVTSTPTIKTNYISRLAEQADDKRHYFVPCPHCREMIEFKFAQIRYSDDKELTNERRAKTAMYVCQECGAVIEDKHKPNMLMNGEWRSVNNPPQKPKRVAFWLNSLYSIFVSWEDVSLKFLDSKDDPEELQNFVNSWLAEAWEDTKLKTNADLVLEKQTNLEEFVVPPWAKLLTGGVDIQQTSVYWTIRAYGDYITSQNIAHGQCMNLNQVREIMNRVYTKENGEEYIVSLCGVDSGFNSDVVYDFCVNNMEWAVPIKGSSNPLQTHYNISKVSRNGLADNLSLIVCDGGKYKDMIAGRMIRDKNSQGTWLVYSGCDIEYAEQVTAEHKIQLKTSNGVRNVWVPKTSHADNHYLDCEVYSLCCADILNIRSIHLMDVKTEEFEEHHKAKEEDWLGVGDSWLGGE